jgi:glycosyltransferase involved in cell wall biosynthesis
VRVSFFVQAYNTESYVAECIQSILDQRGDYELDILVIDDASTDATAAEVAKLQDARLRFVRNPQNKGAIATANDGYRSVSGDAIVRVDSDDRLRPDFLARTLPRLDEDPARGLVYGDIATVDAHGRITCEGGMVRRGVRPAAGNEFFPLLLENFIPAPATLVRRDALLPLLPIPADFRFLDWYLTTGITERWDSYYVDEVVADYRLHSANMHHAMVLDRTGEATSARILARLFSNGLRVEEKARWRHRAYGRHYLTYADKYFGCGLDSDARRCYLQAIRHLPSLSLNPGVMRRLLGTVVGRRLYESAKSHFVSRADVEHRA